MQLEDPEQALTLAATPGMNMGRVSKIIGLASSGNKMTNLSLIDLVRLRLTKRRVPTFDSLEEYVRIRTSCHLVEEIDGQFFCDCRSNKLPFFLNLDKPLALRDNRQFYPLLPKSSSF